MSVQTVADGSNFTVINVGKFSELNRFSFVLPNLTIEGKVYLSQPAKLTGCEISYNSMKPGATLPFYHFHRKHEEVYCILSGTGEYQIDDKVFPIVEGTVVRVGTGANQNIKNTGTVPLVYQCIQTTENSYQKDIPNEYEITQIESKFSK